jgi:hypothetical protein
MSQDENEEEGEALMVEDNLDILDTEDERQSAERSNKLNNHGSNRSQKQTSNTILGKPQVGRNE